MVSLRAYGIVLTPEYCRMVSNPGSPPYAFATLSLSKQTFENLHGEPDWAGGRSEMQLDVGEETLSAAHIVGRRNQGRSSEREGAQIGGEQIWVLKASWRRQV